MDKIFEHLSSSWIRYFDYEWRTAKDGHEYLTPTAEAGVRPYDPLKQADQLLLDALNIGLQSMHKAPKDKLKKLIREFACQYGLLGLMTALPTTSKFLSYQQVYFPKNPFIREEVMNTRAYLNYFFPFTPVPLTIHPGGGTIDLPDQTSFAIMMTYHNEPEAMAMSFMQGYSERYDWLISIFRDWAFTYHMELRDKPTIVWDFHSLLAGIKLMLSFRLTDDQHPLRLCEQCQRAFIGKRKDSKFCSVECRRKWTAEHPGV